MEIILTGFHSGKSLGQAGNGKEGFQDYIPPHKNLGAIFIKAYKSQDGRKGKYSK